MNGRFTVGNTASGGVVPVAVVQDAFVRSRLSLSEVCRRLGWVSSGHSPDQPDTARLKRALGLMPYRTGRVERSCPTCGHVTVTPRHSKKSDAMTQEMAVRLASAMHADPVDWGF